MASLTGGPITWAKSSACRASWRVLVMITLVRSQPIVACLGLLTSTRSPRSGCRLPSYLGISAGPSPRCSRGRCVQSTSAETTSATALLRHCPLPYARRLKLLSSTGTGVQANRSPMPSLRRGSRESIPTPTPSRLRCSISRRRRIYSNPPVLYVTSVPQAHQVLHLPITDLGRGIRVGPREGIP